MNEPTSKLQRYRTLHLFAGVGGGILADLLLGHCPICAVEIDSYCQQVLSARQKDGLLPWFPIYDDVRTFDGKPWRGIADIVCGGFPCQDISLVGKGKGISGEKSGLWKEMARVIREIRPKYAFVENSPALTFRGLDTVLSDLAEMGYDAEWGVLGADDAGGVHQRKRVWIVASNTGRIRVQRNDAQQICGFRKIPWDEDVRSVEDLRKRSDLPEPLVRRINHDVPNGVDRLKAIGNGQVPRVAALAWRILSDRSEHPRSLKSSICRPREPL